MDETEIVIRCAYDELVDIKKLKVNPRNRNEHPEEQILEIIEIIKYSGWRNPIKVSTRSGFMTAGHGRLIAAKRLKMKTVPVDYQDYESEEQEYADMTADNALQLWSKLDLAGINVDLGDLGPELNPRYLGIKNLTIDVSEKIDPELKETNPNFQNAIQVNLQSEEETAELYAELKARGLEVKVLSL